MLVSKKMFGFILAMVMVTSLIPSGLTALAGTPGNVTNLLTKYNALDPNNARTTGVTNSGLYALQGASGAPVTAYNESTGYFTNQSRVDAALANNPYFTADKTRWAYGDRTTNATYSGANTDNTIFHMTQYAMLDSTSSILQGPNVTKVMALNTEKNFTPSIPDLYSFTISKPATIYTATQGTYFDENFVTNNGWIKENNVSVMKSSTTIVQGNNGKYYSVPNGGYSVGTVYSKHYNAGTVNIPSRGGAAANGLYIYVVWDDCNTNTMLNNIVVGGNPVPNFSQTTTSYNVSLPYGTTVAPTVTATPSFSGATVSIANAATLPGSATITVTGADGVSQSTYSINYTVDSSLAYYTDPGLGSVMFEAENTTLNNGLFGITADASASGGNVITALVNQSTAPSNTTAGSSFYISPDRATPYSVWIRYSATSAQNSLYLSVDGSAYTTKTLGSTSSYQWANIYTTGNQPSAGSKFEFKLYPAKAGLRIDKVIVTTYPFYTPSGAVTTLNNMAFGYTLPSGAYPMPSITPPAAHPRLLFKPSDISTIKANMVKSQNANALATYNTYLTSERDGLLNPIVLGGDTNYNGGTLAIIEAYALKYALDGDATYGNKAIAAIKNYMRTVAFTDSVMDITRAMGHTVYVASEVYDWCYPLLTNEDKNFIIVAGESLAKRMETSWPPSKQGGVTGHGGEAQLLRDMLGFGIAVYNERPDIYNYVAGRLLSQFVEPRDYWFTSHTHHQGDSYGNYRHVWELLFQWIMYRMSGETVFAPDMEYLPYQRLYTRRPDGQEFRNGDSGNNKGAVIGTSWTGNRTPDFYSANFYGNVFVKNLYMASDPNLNGFSTGNGYLTPVAYLLLNNPDLGSQTHTQTFPLAKYFGSPYGMMVARTGWTELGQANVNLNSNVAMAQMIIGEQWSANHQHLDAGSFQLYYKGPLAIDSGVYDTYGGNHDKNYHKETIAHNAMLIYDPNESIYGGAVNSGGQRRCGPEVSTFSQWMSNGYDIGKVLDRSFDATSTELGYSYIKGDITRAYSGKVSEVLRSMMFLPLDDANHPAALIVMDKVTSSNPAFKKTWLLHSQQEPELSGNTAIIKRNTDGYNGRMDLTTLLPAGATMTKIGGEGNEFNINGINYEPESFGKSGTEYGAWRIEQSPSSANATDYFFNVMQVSDASANATPLQTELIETNVFAGVKVAKQVAVFGKNKARMGGPIALDIPGSETSGLEILVGGIAEGEWKIYKDFALVGSATATEDGGIIRFTGGAGEYDIIHTGSQLDTTLLKLSYDGGENILGSGETDYTVSLPNGTQVAPAVTAIPANSSSAIVITNASGVPGTTTIVVTSPDGLASQTYTVRFTKPEDSDPTLASLSYTYYGKESQVDLQNATTNRLTAHLPYGNTVMPVVSAAPTYSGATINITQPTAFPGTAQIHVTSADESQTKIYYLRFTTPSGNVTNIVNNMSTRTYEGYKDLNPLTLSQLRDVYAEYGTNWGSFCKPYMDRDFTSVSNVPSGGSIPADPSLTRIPSNEWYMYWFANDTVSGDTSSYFNGASWIATSNSDLRPESVTAYATAKNPDAITFDIDRSATVWVAMQGNVTLSNFTDHGWTRVAEQEGYQLVHADGARFNYFYKKSFAPGRVEIPSYGQSTNLPSRGYVPIVMWADNRTEPMVTWPEVGAISYGQTIASAISGGAGEGSFTIVDSSEQPNAGVYTKTITFVPNDYLSHNILTRDVTVTVNKLDPVVSWPSAGSLTGYEGDKLSDIALEEGFSWAAPDTVLAVPGGTYTMIYTPQDIVNYNGLTKDVAVTVVQEEQRFLLSSGTGSAGGTVSLTLSISNVANIKGIQGKVVYNKDLFELDTADTNQDGSPDGITPPSSDSFNSIWATNINNANGTVNFLGGRTVQYADNETAKPTVMTLHFKVKANAPAGEYPITVENGQAVTAWGAPVVLTAPLNGSITVQNAAMGDINADGEIDISDVVMAAEIAVGYTSYNTQQIARANVSSKTNTTVDISDVVLIIERVLGATTPFPAEL